MLLVISVFVSFFFKLCLSFDLHNSFWFDFTGPNECQVLGKVRECDEAAESLAAWENCSKNPNHEHFFPVQDATTIPLFRSLDYKDREWLRLTGDLTVRLRVNYTSRSRPDGYPFSYLRGLGDLRVGTGFILSVSSRTYGPCPCDICDKQEMREHWIFTVRTAQHVVYDTSEAKETKVDLFYDDERSQEDGKMVTVQAVKVYTSKSTSDTCNFYCVTHDEMIGRSVESLHQRWHSLSYGLPLYLGLVEDIFEGFVGSGPLFTDDGQYYVVIISHPHGQAKKITVGRVRDGMRDGMSFEGDDCVEYHTDTCPGSSGAWVFPFFPVSKHRRLRRARLRRHFWGSVHSGSTGQFNYGNRSGPIFSISDLRQMALEKAREKAQK